MPGTASVKYYFSDHLGSASVVTNAAGAMPPLEESDYYPYGGEMAVTNGDPNTYKFTGKERDTESGLDEFGARYYASPLGRFMTPDWSSSPDPVPYGDLDNPQTLNLYSYVKNNPTTLTDADGHCWSWLQGVCNVFQRVFYGIFTDYGFKNYAQVTQIRRNWLLEHVRTEEDAQKVNKFTPKEVNQYYNCLNSQIQKWADRSFMDPPATGSK